MRNLLRSVYSKATEALEGENVISSRFRIVNDRLTIKNIAGDVTEINLRNQDIYILGAG